MSVPYGEWGLKGSSRATTYVVGIFKDELKEFYGPRKGRLIENFINWPTEEEEILRFTRLYGPLFDKADPGKTFRFSVASWGDAYGGNKNVYRQLWELSKNEKCPDLGSERARLN